MEMHMFHVKNLKALRLSAGCLYNKCIQSDYLFIQYDEIPGHPFSIPLLILSWFWSLFLKQFTLFPDLLHQPYLISTVLFMRKME